MLVVEVPRALNHDTAQGLTELVKRRLPAVDGVGLVLDMTVTELVSSIGITALLESEEAAQAVGGRMVLSGVNGELSAFLRMLGLSKRFSTAATVEEGVALLEGGG